MIELAVPIKRKTMAKKIVPQKISLEMDEISVKEIMATERILLSQCNLPDIAI